MQDASLRITDTNTVEPWLEALQACRVSHQTVQSYRKYVTPFVHPLQQQGCQSLDDVHPHHIRRWLLHRQQQNLSTHTLHNSYRNPKAFWDWRNMFCKGVVLLVGGDSECSRAKT